MAHCRIADRFLLITSILHITAHGALEYHAHVSLLSCLYGCKTKRRFTERPKSLFAPWQPTWRTLWGVCGGYFRRHRWQWKTLVLLLSVLCIIRGVWEGAFGGISTYAITTPCGDGAEWTVKNWTLSWNICTKLCLCTFVFTLCKWRILLLLLLILYLLLLLFLLLSLLLLLFVTLWFVTMMYLYRYLRLFLLRKSVIGTWKYVCLARNFFLFSCFS